MPLSPAHSGAAGRLPGQRPLCPPPDSHPGAGQRARATDGGAAGTPSVVLRLEGPGASESEPRMLLKTQGVGKITCESGFGLKAMRGRTLRFVFGPRRRRRLTARVIPLLAQTVGVAACGLCDTGHERENTPIAETAVRATAIPHRGIMRCDARPGSMPPGAIHTI